jgi:hypothetical protein
MLDVRLGFRLGCLTEGEGGLVGLVSARMLVIAIGLLDLRGGSGWGGGGIEFWLLV